MYSILNDIRVIPGCSHYLNLISQNANNKVKEPPIDTRDELLRTRDVACITQRFEQRLVLGLYSDTDCNSGGFPQFLWIRCKPEAFHRKRPILVLSSRRMISHERQVHCLLSGEWHCMGRFAPPLQACWTEG